MSAHSTGPSSLHTRPSTLRRRRCAATPFVAHRWLQAIAAEYGKKLAEAGFGELQTEVKESPEVPRFASHCSLTYFLLWFCACFLGAAVLLRRGLWGGVR